MSDRRAPTNLGPIPVNKPTRWDRFFERFCIVMSGPMDAYAGGGWKRWLVTPLVAVVFVIGWLVGLPALLWLACTWDGR